jgi:hypothetical protein
MSSSRPTRQGRASEGFGNELRKEIQMTRIEVLDEERALSLLTLGEAGRERARDRRTTITSA